MLFVGMMTFPSDAARGSCLIREADKYTANVRSVLDPALDAAISTGQEEVAAGIAAAIAGTEAGQLIDHGIAKWWDPAVQVFPNNPASIVTNITDAQITAVANNILGDIAGQGNSITLANLQALNSVSPGMGDAAVALFFAGVRTYANTLQGAAAFAQDGYASANVFNAAALVNSDLAVFRTALNAYAPYLDQFNSMIGKFTVGQFQSFLADVSTNGASALPPSEIPVGEQIITLANVHLQGTTLTDFEVAVLSEGDTTNEASEFPSTGFTQSALLQAGTQPGGSFDVDCLTCSIAVPEPSSLTLLGIGISLALLGNVYCRRRAAA